MRGEQLTISIDPSVSLGSPPHARGAGLLEHLGHMLVGITPACAGSSCAWTASRPRARDHPRMRGEQLMYAFSIVPSVGSPPHARGAGNPVDGDEQKLGITPACAGSSGNAITTWTLNGDHPRVRGEQQPAPSRNSFNLGSPPRARGAVIHHPSPSAISGITPACAGSRNLSTSSRELRGDHPRVRGEQADFHHGDALIVGSPPRARGAGMQNAKHRKIEGITPACAGSRTKK